MAGLFGIWNWAHRQPAGGERTLAAIAILIASLVASAAMILGVAELMFLMMPVEH